jgi:D-aminopeptidase
MAPSDSPLRVHIGRLPAGPTNSLLDVPGVGVGHATVHYDEPEPPNGRGVARTGVTAVTFGDEWGRPLPAGLSVLNGAGEVTGRSQIEEWGCIETPIFLTSTMQVGRVYDAACTALLREDPRIESEVIIPIVGECDDSWINDVRTMHVTADDVERALAGARASTGAATTPDQGAVGAGTGMSAFGWKAGIGTASRQLSDGHALAVLVLANFGDAPRLTIDGVPIGRHLVPPDRTPPPAGSCIAVAITDAPVDAAGCERLARRVGLGLARTGSVAHHGSGEIFLAIATGLRTARVDGGFGAARQSPHIAPLCGRDLDPYFEAVVDASEEAVINALLHATTTAGAGGRTLHALPHAAVAELLSGRP